MKRCSLGKSCGATCIDAQERCVLEFGPVVSKSLTEARNSLQERVQGELEQVFKKHEKFESEKEVISFLEKNYEQLATQGMEDSYYGGPGQRGSIRSKAWMIGQEGYAQPTSLYPGLSDKDIKAQMEKDPRDLVGALKLHKELYDAARNVAPKKFVQGGVEGFIGKNKAFTFDNPATVEEWAKASGSSYYGKLGRILKNMGFTGNVLGANVSSILQPPGQKGSAAIANMLKRNGYDPKTFAEGSLASKDSWYNFSAKKRAPLITKAIERLKPRLVYLGQQAAPDDRKALNYLMYHIAKELKQVPYHVNHDGKDYKYIVVEHAGGKRTVLLNGWHPTAIGKTAVKVTDREFMQSLANSLMTKGVPPVGVVGQPIRPEVMNSLLGSTKSSILLSKVTKSDSKGTKKEAKAKIVKPEAKQVDKEKQLAGIRQLVVNYQKMGYPTVRVRQELQKLGVPMNLISQVV